MGVPITTRCCHAPGFACAADTEPERWAALQKKAPAGLHQLKARAAAEQDQRAAAERERLEAERRQVLAAYQRELDRLLAGAEWMGEFQAAAAEPDGTPGKHEMWFDLRGVGHQPVCLTLELVLVDPGELPRWVAADRPWRVQGPDGRIGFKTLGEALLAAGELAATPF